MKIKQSILKEGDVLLSHNDKKQHTAIYIGDGMVVHASIGEKGTKGNKAGDQTGKEICVAKLSEEWDFVLRFPDSRIATAATILACDIASDDSYGYDQVNRNGNPDFDCSSLIIFVYEKQGLLLKRNGATFTGNMRDAFKRCGFIEVSDKVSCSVDLIEVYPGDKGNAVKSMQLLLTNKGYSCGGIDGDYGSKTRKALDSFQKRNELTPYDGVCGRGTWRALIL